MNTLKIYWVGKDFFQTNAQEFCFKTLINKELCTPELAPAVKVWCLGLVQTLALLRRLERFEFLRYEIIKDGEQSK